MTVDDWFACDEPSRMVRFLIGTDSPHVTDVEDFPDCKVTDRKLRLVACACYRHIEQLLPNPVARKGVEVTERYVDGLASLAEFLEADEQVMQTLNDLEPRWLASRGAESQALLPTHAALVQAAQATRRLAQHAAYCSFTNASWAVGAIAAPGVGISDPVFGGCERAERTAQAGLVRDIIGPLPFRHVRIEPNWLHWNDRTVTRLASVIYDERRFEDLPILADALEDAGCGNNEILDHCREPGVHVRGCWVVDLLLGKQ